ncbi:hypothetical protein GCM10009841_32160 [Microlunatus panaciterrae]
MLDRVAGRPYRIGEADRLVFGLTGLDHDGMVGKVDVDVAISRLQPYALHSEPLPVVVGDRNLA